MSAAAYCWHEQLVSLQYQCKTNPANLGEIPSHAGSVRAESASTQILRLTGDDQFSRLSRKLDLKNSKRICLRRRRCHTRTNLVEIIQSQSRNGKTISNVQRYGRNFSHTFRSASETGQNEAPCARMLGRDSGPNVGTLPTKIIGAGPKPPLAKPLQTLQGSTS